jgi:hypothetical protein
MSIQIHNGWKIPNTTLEEAFERVQTMRAQVAVLSQDLVAKEAARRWVHRFDARLAFLEDNPEKECAPCSIDDIWNEIHEEQETSRIKRTRQPFVDCEFTMNLYQLDSHVLGISHCEHGDWRDAWLKTSGAYAYGYWDNTDPSTLVDAHGWAKRAKDWSSIFDDMDGIRCDGTGFSAVIHDGRTRQPTPDEVMKHMPCYATRLNERAEDIVRGAEILSLCGGDTSKVNVSNIFSLHSAASKFMKTCEGVDQLAATTRRLELVLPKEITVEMLSSEDMEAAPGAPRQA